ncbi:hypothetical protein HY988_07125 [Candidatus Micrarchaeota archaeon]|nr:hypothetical protein [Candidatus Micrarchaeota archaeon]
MNKDPNPKRRSFRSAALLFGLGLASVSLAAASTSRQGTDIDSLVQSGKVDVCLTTRNSFRFNLLIANQAPFELKTSEVPSDSPIRRVARACK